MHFLHSVLIARVQAILKAGVLSKPVIGVRTLWLFRRNICSTGRSVPCALPLVIKKIIIY